MNWFNKLRFGKKSPESVSLEELSQKTGISVEKIKEGIVVFKETGETKFKVGEVIENFSRKLDNDSVKISGVKSENITIDISIDDKTVEPSIKDDFIEIENEDGKFLIKYNNQGYLLEPSNID